MSDNFFFDRRKGERRSGVDPRKNPRLDLAHRRRRKGDDRRKTDNLVEDFGALTGEVALDIEHTGVQKH